MDKYRIETMKKMPSRFESINNPFLNKPVIQNNTYNDDIVITGISGNSFCKDKLPSMSFSR